MRVIQPVSQTLVKRCFVVSDLLSKRTYASDSVFESALEKALKRVLAMDDSKLDSAITDKKRLAAYGRMDWRLVSLRPHEIGVWRQAGELPHKWTHGDVSCTARHLKKSMQKGISLAGRVGEVFPSVLDFTVYFKTNKYLFPIAFRHNNGTFGRIGAKSTFADVDDGCMRTIAMTLAGSKQMRFYLGTPKPGFMSWLREKGFYFKSRYAYSK